MVIRFANGDVRKIKVTRSAVTSLTRIGIYDIDRNEDGLLIQAIITEKEKKALIKALNGK